MDAIDGTKGQRVLYWKTTHMDSQYTIQVTQCDMVGSRNKTELFQPTKSQCCSAFKVR